MVNFKGEDNLSISTHFRRTEGLMARYKPNEFAHNLLIPISLQEQLMPGSLEYTICTLVDERVDMSLFDEKYCNDEKGRRAYAPRILLKVVLLGYSRGLTSSRKIEQACRENVVFMALSCGQYPDHSTIATFLSSMKEEILPLFRDVLLVCEEMELLGERCLHWIDASFRVMHPSSGVESNLERL